MQIIQSLAVNSDCYKDGKYISPKGLMLHSVGVPQDNPMVFFNNWNKPKGNACVHAVIGTNGDVIQMLPWTKRGWHAGGAGNNSLIGVEMVEPSFISYTSGSKWKVKDNHTLDEVENFIKDTYNTAVELFAFLCHDYNLNPLDKKVVMSHSEGYRIGVASNHGDVEHLWSKFGMTMDKFRSDVNTKLQMYKTYIPNNDTKLDISQTNSKESSVKGVKIMGNAVASMSQCIKAASIHGVAPLYIDLISDYYNQGKIEGVRPDIAFAQSCLETGWFTFKGDVKASQNNFAGIGATGNGVVGESYKSPSVGVAAQIQHLKAYASTDELRQPCIDTRFKYVKRGSAPTIKDLSIPNNKLGVGWAADKDYASKILAILDEIINTKVDSSQDKLNIDVNYSEVANVDDKLNSNKVSVNKGESISNKFEQFTVKIISNNLNIRVAPNGQVVGCIRDRGVYTIVEVSSDGQWGRLKSGKGWISLNSKYTKKI